MQKPANKGDIPVGLSEGSLIPENGVQILKSKISQIFHKISLAKISILYTFYEQYALLYTSALIYYYKTILWIFMYNYGKLTN